MDLLALWLLGVGIADLVRWESAEPGGRRLVGAAVAGGLVMLAVALVGGLSGVTVVAFTVAATVGVAGWLMLSTFAGRGWVGVWAPLFSLLVPILTLLGASGHLPSFQGALLRWYSRLGVPTLSGVSLGRFCLVVGVLVFLQSSANVVVRLVLRSAGSPAERGETALRGGRLLGPMERTFIFALGLAGELTAASIIVAAKGLLRFPEIRSTADRGVGVDELTEYFLVGTLTSWLLALAFLPLL